MPDSLRINTRDIMIFKARDHAREVVDPSAFLGVITHAAATCLGSERFDDSFFNEHLYAIEWELDERHEGKIFSDIRELEAVRDSLNTVDFLPGSALLIHNLGTRHVHDATTHNENDDVIPTNRPMKGFMHNKLERGLLSFINRLSMILYLEGNNLRAGGWSAMELFWDSFYTPEEGINPTKFMVIRERIKHLVIAHGEAQRLPDGNALSLSSDNVLAQR